MSLSKTEKEELVMSHCLHCIVAGKVQGVFFRASTQQQAKQLNLTGWVKNLPDGRVEVFACGEQDKLDKLHKWLHLGPKQAQVESIEELSSNYQEHTSFEVLK